MIDTSRHKPTNRWIMTINTDIDRQLAELEAMVDGSVDRPDEGPKRKSKVPGWLAVVAVAAVVDLAARFFVPSSQSFVLILEGLIFAIAGGVLLLPILKRRPLSTIRRRVHIWLGGAFILGTIRSGMWGLGAPVEYANLTIFLLGLGALAIAWLKRKRVVDETLGH